MEITDLPEEMQEAIVSLKHGSATIEADIHGALEEAESIEEFQSSAEACMNALIQEAEEVKAIFCKADEPVVLDAARYIDWIHHEFNRFFSTDLLPQYKTLWDLPQHYLPKCMFCSGFETACRVLPHDSAGVRITEEAAKDVPVSWTNIPQETANREQASGAAAELSSTAGGG